MDQNYELQYCPMCGSLNLSPGIAEPEKRRFPWQNAPFARLLRSFGSHTTARWICRDCGNEFEMKA